MNRELALELADWLSRMREGNEESIARHDPVIRAHIAKLAKWEKMVRDLAGKNLVTLSDANDFPTRDYSHANHQPG
jgi:hypothetical protein